MNIHVHIERLVLEGLPITARQGASVQAAVEAELTHLLAAGGLAANLRSGGALRSVRASEMNVTAGNSPTLVGQQIARSVYSGIGETK